MAGEIPPMGLGAEPKNMPVAAKKSRVSHEERNPRTKNTLLAVACLTPYTHVQQPPSQGYW
jgi:hypothetical protein